MPFQWSRMRTYSGALVALGLLLGLPLAVPLAVPVARAAGDLLSRWRVRRMSDLTSQPSPSYRPLLDIVNSPSPSPDALNGILGDAFDPAEFDEVAVAGNGRILAYTALNLSGGRDVVLSHEGRAGSSDRFERISLADGGTDHPQIAFDKIGTRLVARGAEPGDAVANIYLRSTRRGPGGTDGTPGDVKDGMRNITALPRVATDPDPTDEEPPYSVEGTAWDPCIAALTRTVEIKGGYKLIGRDARVAFVCTADLDKGGRDVLSPRPGANEHGAAQLFLWSERADRFRQLTDNPGGGGTIDRPSMNGRATLIAFESDADLTPGAVDPLDSSHVGNPGGVRQIFVWRRGLGVQQITWSASDCFSPRTDRLGRAVWFSTRGDLIPGGNPEGNSEIFRWRRGGPVARRLQQLTSTEAGDSVFPRPSDRANQFVFYSNARPRTSSEKFGTAPADVLPKAYAWRRGRVDLVHGSLDIEGNPYFYGPPAPGTSLTKVHLGTNDPLPHPPAATPPGDTPTIPTTFFMVRATRFRR